MRRVRLNFDRVAFRSMGDLAMELKMQLTVIAAVASLGLVAAIVLGIV